MDGGASSWLRSYLVDRQQFVKLCQHSSAVTQCSSCVPLGSVLGPLICTAYVAPVGDLIDVSYHTFADDTQLLVATNSNDAAPALNRLADCSAALKLWFPRNDLQLNADESEVVSLGTAPQLRSTAAISTIVVAPKLKSFGVTIDSHLRFDSQGGSQGVQLCWHSTTPTRTRTRTPTRQPRLQSYVRHTLFPREASRGNSVCRT